MTQHGEIQRVFYAADENQEILSLKKVILGTLSSKLVLSEQMISEQKRWGYQSEETAHDGKRMTR